MNQQELLDLIDHLNWKLANMTIHQINFTKRGQDLQDKIADLWVKVRKMGG
jgi:hypothetical protein